MVSMKATLLCVLLCLLWSLVEVQSQIEYPYITFKGTTLSNHSYVDLGRVWDNRSSNTLQCDTDLVLRRNVVVDSLMVSLDVETGLLLVVT